MRTITSAEFRRDYAVLTEPVVVTANRRTLGTWTPGATLSPEMTDQLGALAETFATSGRIGRSEDPAGVLAKELSESQAEVRRLKRELAKRPVVPAAVLGAANAFAQSDSNPAVRRARQARIDEALRKVNRTTKPK